MNRPPAWAVRLIALLTRGPDREFIVGDLSEQYQRIGLTRFVARGLLSATSTWKLQPGSGLTGDMMLAVRQIRRRPRVFVGAGFVLSIGLGMGTVTWGVLYGSHGKGLPVSNPDQVLMAQLNGPGIDWGELGFSAEDKEAIANAPAVSAVARWHTSEITLRTDGIGGIPRRTSAVFVDPVIGRMLEFNTTKGRLLLSSDAEPTAQPVVVLSNDVWLARFDSDPGVVGRTVSINDIATTVVGVLSPTSRLSGHNEVWLPIADVNREARRYFMLLETAEGTDLDELNLQLATMSNRLREHGDSIPLVASALPIGMAFRGPHTSIFTRVIKWSGVFLFIMALANTANLFIVHARRRSHEMNIRRALGASRFRVLRQIGIEALVPAIIGVGGALWIASAGLTWYQHAAVRYAGGQLDAWRGYQLETPHIVIIVVGALLSTVVVALMTSINSNIDHATLRSSRGSTSPSFKTARSLLSVEIALGGALMLLASLMLKSGWNLQTNDWGFETDAVMTGQVTLPDDGYQLPEERLAFWREVESSLAAIPGVRHATVATQLPMIRFGGRWRVRRPIETFGEEAATPQEVPVHYLAGVTPDYFQTFDVVPVSGRAFSTTDVAGSAPVAIVNTGFAERYFPNESPIGQQLRFWNGDQPDVWRTIVGVAPTSGWTLTRTVFPRAYTFRWSRQRRLRQVSP